MITLLTDSAVITFSLASLAEPFSLSLLVWLQTFALGLLLPSASHLPAHLLNLGPDPRIPAQPPVPF